MKQALRLWDDYMDSVKDLYRLQIGFCEDMKKFFVVWIVFWLLMGVAFATTAIVLYCNRPTRQF